MKKFLVAPVAMAAIFMSSCASSYKTLPPSQLSYSKASEPGPSDVTVEYNYDYLTEKRSKAYYKKKQRAGLQVVALKITNSSEQDLEYPKDFQLYFGEEKLPIIPADSVRMKLQQPAPVFLLYLLLAKMNLTTSEMRTSNGVVTDESKHFYPIGLIIGPALALSNYLVASNANKKFGTDLKTFSLLDKTIKKGDTVYAVVGIKERASKPVSIRLTNK